MVSNWDKYSRFSIDAASTAASLGFGAAKFGTKLGFSITRGIASTAAHVTGSVVDYALFGGTTGAGQMLGGAVSSAISLVEQIALAPIALGETITSTSVIAAHSSISVLSAIFPGSDEASFSLASIVELVRREWNDPLLREYLPEEKYGVTDIARALVAWSALQGVTKEWQEKRWFKYLREIDPSEDEPVYERTRRDSRITVTTDVIYPGQRGQIITADITDADSSPTPRSTSASTPSRHLQVPKLHHINPCAPRQPSNDELKATLRRLSKLVLAGYGGASLLFFGVSLDPPEAASTSTQGITSARFSRDTQKVSEEAKLTKAVNASEAEASSNPVTPRSPTTPSTSSSYVWWDVLLGRHDQEIFTKFADHLSSEQERKERKEMVQREMVEERKRKISAVIGNERLMPRFWVLSDHGRRQVVLVLRGTMSLNELAVDLTCDPEEFEPASTARDDDIQEDSEIPGAFPIDVQMHSFRAKQRRQRTISTTSTLGGSNTYQVHGGMLRMARVMGGKGKPVHVAVKDALQRNPGYELVLSGHSLGAAVAALLGMLWADPRTCLTVRSSGLPAGRRVSVYCFAPPCVADGPLSRLCSSLITSFVYSNDVVSRLSLGSVRDITRAAAWLCESNARSQDDGYASVTKRALKRKTGLGAEGEDEWFLSIRKTLEANMHMANMYPPGRVWWAMRDSDLHPSNRRYGGNEQSQNKARLFEVLDVERTFDQIIFARDMLSSHLPHQYDRVLQDM
ncbi:alpha/beta-hydrolase [Neolentinus lepideus HHB14362 ss-1]|uniref:sn-1-specific diacylglycerol lipase n=1 Tax=Neolentinus lepideus HHB14362 ss-1 TaxID=1314782 RepID=A0A165P7Q0_9AGAM|nr:alpha/beta-hydrolase [Neolentinus lepideus HHB14362 ss-1]